jgi:hypothetical protein
MRYGLIELQFGVDELFEVVVFRRTIEGIYELTQQDAFPKDYNIPLTFPMINTRVALVCGHP